MEKEIIKALIKHLEDKVDRLRDSDHWDEAERVENLLELIKD